MGFRGRILNPRPALGGIWIGLLAILGSTGCLAPRAGHSGDPPTIAMTPSSPPRWAGASPVPVIVDTPRADDDHEVRLPAPSTETWVVHTRACDQTIGSNPWPGLTVARLDDEGGPLHGSEPGELFDRMAGRPCVILIHGYGYTFKEAAKEAVEVRAQLEALGGLTPEHLFIVFHWPSERELPGLVRDLNEKSRRSRIASYHLARFLQASPAGSTICLMGQSNGGRITLTTMHLLSGAVLPSFLREPAVQLSSGRTDLRIRGVILAAAAGHTWLNPGERLDQALPNCEALLNLRNSGDYALAVYALGRYTGLRPAIGRVGLRPDDLAKLGPLKDRVEEYNLHPLSGADHTLFPRALTYPIVAERIASYTSWRELSAGGRAGEDQALHR